MRRLISFEEARRQYVHRYTMEHKPEWAKLPCAGNGRFYAPQYSTDREWYANTIFPGEGPEAGDDHCYSTGQTWPLGKWLEEEFQK